MATTPSTMTRKQWADGFLSAGGWPITLQNEAAVIAWQYGEGTAAAWNPLATTLGAPGATNFNSSGVKNYPDPMTGIYATVNTVKNTPAYQGINAALSKGTSAQSVLSAVVMTGTWTGPAALSALPTVLKNFASVSGLYIDPTLNQAGSDKGAAVSGVGPINPLSGMSGLISGVDSILTEVSSLAFWKRVGMFALGGAFVIIGTTIFMSDSKTVRSAVATASKGAE